MSEAFTKIRIVYFSFRMFWFTVLILLSDFFSINTLNLIEWILSISDSNKETICIHFDSLSFNSYSALLYTNFYKWIPTFLSSIGKRINFSVVLLDNSLYKETFLSFQKFNKSNFENCKHFLFEEINKL